jgi:hypothetical protein
VSRFKRDSLRRTQGFVEVDFAMALEE